MIHRFKYLRVFRNVTAIFISKYKVESMKILKFINCMATFYRNFYFMAQIEIHYIISSSDCTITSRKKILNFQYACHQNIFSEYEILRYYPLKFRIIYNKTYYLTNKIVFVYTKVFDTISSIYLFVLFLKNWCKTQWDSLN